jgi:hypothetical protein
LSGECFSTIIPTLATTTILWMRVRLANGDKTWRIVRGKYLLRVIGHGDPQKPISDDTTQLLAGNAFSGYAAGPMLLCLFAAVGLEGRRKL